MYRVSKKNETQIRQPRAEFSNLIITRQERGVIKLSSDTFLVS